MLKQTMTAMQIDRIHVKQDTTHTVVAMCADDTTIFAGRLDDITHAKEAIQCHMDASGPFVRHSFVLTAHISWSECCVWFESKSEQPHTCICNDIEQTAMLHK